MNSLTKCKCFPVDECMSKRNKLICNVILSDEARTNHEFIVAHLRYWQKRTIEGPVASQSREIRHLVASICMSALRGQLGVLLLNAKNLWPPCLYDQCQNTTIILMGDT